MLMGAYNKPSRLVCRADTNDSRTRWRCHSRGAVFDHRNGAENASQFQQVRLRRIIALCRHVLETFGDGVSLEFYGVEPNISHDTDPAFERSLQYLPNAGEVDPRKYGDFMLRLLLLSKEGSPDVRCIPAGTAFFDREFTEGCRESCTMRIFMTFRGTLVNGLSFHPYRDGEPEEACGKYQMGKIVGQIHGSYEDQLRALWTLEIHIWPSNLNKTQWI